MAFKKDFVSLKDLNAEEIMNVLDTAETMRYILGVKSKKAPHLSGKTVIILFYEKSARTKLSFELAAQYLSADVVDLSISNNLSSGGTLVETGRIIDQMGADFIVIRHPMSGAARLFAENVTAGVINAGDGINENPSQSLLDLMTIKNQKGGFKGLNVTIVGDVAHSRVAKSNIWALLKLGANVSVAGPPTLIPDSIEGFGVKVYYNAREAVEGADVVMSLRMKEERQYGNLLPSYNEYSKLFMIDMDMLNAADKNVIVMHPGPINREVEISARVIDSKYCLVNDQIVNGVAVRMALLYLMSII